MARGSGAACRLDFCLSFETGARLPGIGRPLQPRQRRPYHVLGNLLSVLLPDDTFIEYIADGKNRRVAKLVNGTPVRKWLYQDDLNPVVKLDGDGNLLHTYAYASHGHSPDYAAAANGTVYPIAADHLGSPVLVVKGPLLDLQ